MSTGEPVTSRTRFSAGSLTKSMVATVIAGLAEAGRLSLDDPVAGHVPELPSDGWAGRATVRDLLANRSGLALRAGLEFGFDSRKDEGDGALARLVADAAEGVPAGGFWSYTNVGWCVLGRVIETAAAAAWEEAMRRHLLKRAGMGETIFGASHPRATGHEMTAEGPGAGRAADRTRLRPGRYQCRHDDHRSSPVRRLAPGGPLARRAAGRARGSSDPRLARFLVSRLGPVRLGQ